MNSIETKIGRVVVAKIVPDEDLIDAIKEIVSKHHIKAGLINVIGAFKKFTIGYFDIPTKKYILKTFEENVEMISCMGNISYKEEEPIIHLHVTLGKEDLSLIGGHLSQPSIISVTGEVYIYETAEKLSRTTDPQFNLALLDL